MADLSIEPGSRAVFIRPMTESGEQWVAKFIDREIDSDGTVRVDFADAPRIERAAREDGLIIGEMAI